MTESRTRKSIRNSATAIFFFAIQFILGFYSRKIFLDRLGTEILGLNTTATNILQFLNLAELGISAAITFSLYKPLHDNDTTKINELITLQGKFYRRVAMMIIAGAIIVMMFFPVIFHKTRLPLWYAYASFSVLLYSQLLGYFVNYRQIALTAAQKDYKVQASVGTTNLLKILSQIVALSLSNYPYQWWLALEILFSTLSCIVLNITIKRTFGFLRKSQMTYVELKDKYSSILKKTKQVFFHSIAGFVLTQSSPLIIYAYSSLTIVAIYGNYLIITSGLQRMTVSFFQGMSAGVGDLIAERNYKHIREVFFQLFSLRFLVSAWVAFSMLILSKPFISLWIGNQYLLPLSTVGIISATLFIMLNRNTVGMFLYGFGQYQDIWSPIIEATLNIGLSILLGYYFGLNGIISGVLISLILVVEIWKPYFLFTWGLKERASLYFSNYLAHLGIAAIVGTTIWILSRPFTEDIINSRLGLIVFGISTSGTFLILTGLIMYIIFPNFRIVMKAPFHKIFKS